MHSHWIVLGSLALAACARAHSEPASAEHSSGDALAKVRIVALDAPAQHGSDDARKPSHVLTAHEAPAKDFRLASGLGEVSGRLRPVDAKNAEIEVALEVRSATRPISAVYRYVLRVQLDGDDAIELCMNDRHMYAIVPSRLHTWGGLVSSDEDLSKGLELVRLDGAGEER
jgi:hypothetical protein